MSSPRRGEIWMAWMPDEPKERPVVVFSEDFRNEYAFSVVGIPLTTNRRPAPTHVDLTQGQGGLPQHSVARCENISMIMKSRMRRGTFQGTISDDKLLEIQHGVARALDFRYGPS